MSDPLDVEVQVLRSLDDLDALDAPLKHPAFRHMWRDAGFPSRVAFAVKTGAKELLDQVETQARDIEARHSMRVGGEPEWMHADAYWRDMLSGVAQLRAYLTSKCKVRHAQ